MEGDACPFGSGLDYSSQHPVSMANLSHPSSTNATPGDLGPCSCDRRRATAHCPSRSLTGLSTSLCRGRQWGEAGRPECPPALCFLTLPSCVSRIESLLMSRWMTPWAWSTDKACSTARHTAAICSSFILHGGDRGSSWAERPRASPGRLSPTPGSSRAVPSMGDDVGEGPALQELHHHPELVAHQVAVVHLHHVLVLVVTHDHHLAMGAGQLSQASRLPLQPRPASIPSPGSPWTASLHPQEQG